MSNCQPPDGVGRTTFITDTDWTHSTNKMNTWPVLELKQSSQNQRVMWHKH